MLLYVLKRIVIRSVSLKVVSHGAGGIVYRQGRTKWYFSESGKIKHSLHVGQYHRDQLVHIQPSYAARHTFKTCARCLFFARIASFSPCCRLLTTFAAEESVEAALMAAPAPARGEQEEQDLQRNVDNMVDGRPMKLLDIFAVLDHRKRDASLQSQPAHTRPSNIISTGASIWTGNADGGKALMMMMDALLHCDNCLLTGC